MPNKLPPHVELMLELGNPQNFVKMTLDEAKQILAQPIDYLKNCNRHACQFAIMLVVRDQLIIVKEPEPNDPSAPPDDLPRHDGMRDDTNNNN